MSSTTFSVPIDATVPQRQETSYWGLSLTAWVKVLVITALMLWLFYVPNLRRLWLKTNPFFGEANWGHSICVPLIGLYYLYINRESLLGAPVKTAWSGLLFLIGGLLLFAYGIWPGQNDFIKDFGMVVTLFGTVLFLCGWSVMKIAWFPIVFLVCAIPWPGLVYSWVAGPLQRLAAEVAVFTLQFTGVTSGSSGTKIFIGGVGGGQLRTLNVAEACAGLRSLMTFISVGAAVAFLSSRPLWQKLVITASSVPIAIFCNVMRVSGQGLLDHYVSQELSQSFAHQFVGLIMLVPAFFLILFVGWFLDRVFLEEVDRRDWMGRSVSNHKPAMAGVPRPQLKPAQTAHQRKPATAQPVAAAVATATADAPVKPVPRQPLPGGVRPATSTGPRRGYVPPKFQPPPRPRENP